MIVKRVRQFLAGTSGDRLLLLRAGGLVTGLRIAFVDPPVPARAPLDGRATTRSPPNWPDSA